MSILELPKEILQEIWRFITKIEDILRFGATCKKMESLSFTVGRHIHLTDDYPIEIWKNILSRDLQHMRTLSCVYYYRPKNTHSEAIWVIDKLITLSTLRNLNDFGCRFINIGRSDKPNLAPKFLDLAQTIKDMTWLENIEMSFPLPDNCNIGELFKDHSILTKLELAHVDQHSGRGYNSLTQIKSLEVSYCAIRPEVLQQIVSLDNLTELDLSETWGMEAELYQLSKLTNLEVINLKGLGSFIDLKILESLPKLDKLFIDSGEEEYMAELLSIEDLNRLTQLKYLDIYSGKNFSLDPTGIANLTNLEYLSFEMQLDCKYGSFADFSVFERLTSLKIFNVLDVVKHIGFPHRLKHLSIPRLQCEDTMNRICQVDSIESLSLYWWGESADSLIQISRLTNLRNISLAFSQKLEGQVLPHLTGLHHLQSMTIDIISTLQDVDALKQLTQLQQLTIRHVSQNCPLLTLREIRQQLPSI